jgi:hypothetical protein
MNKIQSYYFTARCLALEIPENKDFIKSHIKDIDWSVFVKIANNHLILPGIYSSYRKNDMLDLLPEELREHLKEIHAINTERNKEILLQVEELNSILNKQNIIRYTLKELLICWMNYMRIRATGLWSILIFWWEKN